MKIEKCKLQIAVRPPAGSGIWMKCQREMANKPGQLNYSGPEARAARERPPLRAELSSGGPAVRPHRFTAAPTSRVELGRPGGTTAPFHGRPYEPS